MLFRFSLTFLFRRSHRESRGRGQEETGGQRSREDVGRVRAELPNSDPATGRPA